MVGAGAASGRWLVQTDGRTTGFSRRAAWWAFKRAAAFDNRLPLVLPIILQQASAIVVVIAFPSKRCEQMLRASCTAEWIR